MKIFKIILSFLLLLFSNVLLAQQDANSWMDNTMYESGKINVVVAVISIIFVALFIYMFALDRRIRKMEEEIKGKNNN